jgi:NAD(P)-dependent dehydrogenase (short-subunit alcohol dehydrogenase family)
VLHDACDRLNYAPVALSPNSMSALPRTALVTGAAKRLGREIAVGLARAGWDVGVHYRQSRAEAEQTVAAIEALGRRSRAFAADLEDESAIARMFDSARAEMGPIACLVNSASRFEFDQPESFSFAMLERHLRPNLAAPVLLARNLYESLAAIELRADRGVVINLLDQKLDAFDEAHRIAPLGQSSRPADIVQAVVYLADAPAVTGVNLIVDGGQHLMGLERDVMFLTGKS